MFSDIFEIQLADRTKVRGCFALWQRTRHCLSLAFDYQMRADLVVSTIDNVVRPWAMRGKAQLPAIPLLFAVIGGMQAFGFIGLVIGPLVFSLLMSIIDIYKRSFGLRQSESEVA